MNFFEKLNKPKIARQPFINMVYRVIFVKLKLKKCYCNKWSANCSSFPLRVPNGRGRLYIQAYVYIGGNHP